MPKKKTRRVRKVVDNTPPEPPKPKVQAPAGIKELQKKILTKGVKEAMKGFDSAYGVGRIHGADRPIPKIQVYPTGMPDIDDIVIGIGGLPRGRFTEIAGLESSGKTTFILSVIANLQRLGLLCGFVDVEDSLDPEYAEAHGVDTSLMLHGVPMHGEQAIRMAEDFLSGKWGKKKGIPCDAVFIDSIGALKMKVDMERPVEGKGARSQMGGRAWLQEKLVMKAKPHLYNNNSLMVCVSQIRLNISTSPYAPKYRTTTSKELDHEFGLRLFISRTQSITSSDKKIGFKMKVKATKNKVGGKQDAECEMDLIYGDGLSRQAMILDSALRLRVIERKGAWYYLGDRQIAQGREAVKKALTEDEELLNEVGEYVAQKRHLVEVAPEEESVAYDAFDEFVPEDD